MVARPQIPAPAAKAAAVKPAAPAAPKAQPRPAPAPAAVAPAPPVRKPPPSLVDNSDSIPTRVVDNSDFIPTRIAPAPIAAAVKPAAVAAAVKLAQPLAIQPELRMLIDISIAPLEQRIGELQRRIEDLELSSARKAGVATAPAHAPARGPILDIATIERTVTLGPEMLPLDGRRRRRRLLIGSIFAIVVVFGALFAALAESYTHR